MSLFGTSGIRQIANRSLLELSFKVGLAVGREYPRVIIGYDTRTSSEAIKHAVLAGVLAAGGKASDGGVLPTPTLALATRHFDAGIMITASHNPPEYNGIKLFNPDGSSFTREQQLSIENDIDAKEREIARWDNISNSGLFASAVEEHIAHILAGTPHPLRVKVVVDCAAAAACVVTPALLERLGCAVYPLNHSPMGFFPHPVEPVPENLSELMSAVVRMGADLGIAHDGDADRMMAVDDRGRFVTGDHLMQLMASELEAKEIVTTIDASMAIERAGFKVSRTAVGDNNVCDALKGNGYSFGGEPSGAWIFARSSFCPDGIYAAALVVRIASKDKLSRLVDNLPAYPIYRGSFVIDRAGYEKLEKVMLDHFDDASAITIDGLKIVQKDGWFLLRPSGTEPKVRLTIEATSTGELARLKSELVALISDFT